MNFDTAHQRDEDDQEEARKHARMVAQELAKVSGPNIGFDMAAVVAGTTPANIAQLVHANIVRGNRNRRTCSLASLQAWMATRPKKSSAPRRTDRPNE